LSFQVADTGVGIKPQHLKMIGQPFHQADSSSSRRFGGAGLGLSICHRLCTMMDGGIECDSVPGQGSIFKVRLLLESPQSAAAVDSVITAAAAVPVVAPEALAAGAPLAPPRPAYARVEGEAGYILLVEDSPVNQMVATGVLKKMGHRVDVAENGFKAIEALKQNNYDLVLMDCHMPEMDGFKATALLRDPRTGAVNPKVPVIAVTASVLEGSYDKCLEAGMDDYLAKPFKPDQLHDVISRWRRADEVPVRPEPMTRLEPEKKEAVV
jgi:CheY-like chemotaxis protein